MPRRDPAPGSREPDCLPGEGGCDRLEPEGWSAGARALAFLTVCLLAALPHIRVLGNEFLTWDDTIIILSQPFLRELSLENLWRILSPVPAREEWLPVRDLTLAVNFALDGEAPLGFAAGNLLLHVAASLAAFGLLRRLLPSRTAAFLAALFFACHAVHVESVNWLSARKDPLSALFLFLALLAHVRYREGSGRGITSLVFYVLALLSKAHSIVFPLWVVAYDSFYVRGLSRRARLAPLVPLVAATVLFLALYTRQTALDGVVKSYPPGGIPAVLLTDVVMLKEYTLAALFPSSHQAIYRTELLRSVWSGELLLAVAVVTLVGAVAWRFRSARWVPFSCLLFYATFLPYMNLVPHGIYFAERYLYLSSFFFALPAGMLALRLLDLARPRPALSAAVVVALAAYFTMHTGLALHRGRVWADSETFWKYQAEALPDDPAPLMNLGETYELAGRDDLAEEVYRGALERFGSIPRASYRLARIARRRGDLEEALRLYGTAARAMPDDPRPLNNAAEIYLARGEPEKAVCLYEFLCERFPGYLLARRNLARALESLGRAGDARRHWSALVERARMVPEMEWVEEARQRLR